ncbi:hypothetical protein AMET1_1063 [Methanonatronarchaeum thermophilum]|uniref:Uncharacterized protein n=1 Tax=Methanonatronarchaeum thermophilum TaxID=1927129 RepID=A0A1Y3GA86_9EURY|nr:hypothetical protein [Methanonatronarchaeum thermophilum]OUJ18160.1 hypothetical protein AMET1_1063 [Methanonatronarchaeum thermophilum]
MKKYKKTFTVKKIETINDRKIIELINKQGLGNLKITLPTNTEINKGDTYTVTIQEKQ